MTILEVFPRGIGGKNAPISPYLGLRVEHGRKFVGIFVESKLVQETSRMKLQNYTSSLMPDRCLPLQNDEVDVG